MTNLGLGSIPESKLCNSRLRVIRLSSNKLTSLPQRIGKLTNLKVFDFHKNRIDEIPKEIGNCVSLRKVNAKYNSFTCIPSSIGKLENLKLFDIEWFKYCIPPIKYGINKESGKGKETITPIMNRLKDLCIMFKDYGTLTLSVFLSYFSNDANIKFNKEPDYNKQDNRKRTILHRAATAGHIGVVKGLLSIESIDPNQLEKDQCTALGLALRDDNEEIAHILLEKEKVDVNAGNGSFGAPLHIAVSKGKVDIVSKLIKKNADVNKLDFKKQTPLHIIMDVFSRDVKIAEEITRILVFNGAKLNLLDLEKLSPLHRAVVKRHIDGIKLITKLNKELSERGKEQFEINLAGGEKKYTPLFYALEKKDAQTAEMLFTNGAKVCIWCDGEYMPREWKKRESNVRRHILWKMERFETQIKTGRLSITQHSFNNPEIINKIEKTNNCIQGYKTVGSYIRKFNKNKKNLTNKCKEIFQRILPKNIVHHK